MPSREHTYWHKISIAWMHCKSLWIKASAKCINVKVLSQGTVYQGHSVHIGCECSAFPSHLIDWQWYWNWLNIINININSFIFLALTNYVEGTCCLGTCLSKLIKVKLSEDLYCFNYFLHAGQILYVGHVYLCVSMWKGSATDWLFLALLLKQRLGVSYSSSVMIRLHTWLFVPNQIST